MTRLERSRGRWLLVFCLEALAKDNTTRIALRVWCAERELLKLHCDPFHLSTGVTVNIVDRNESVQAARNGDINQSIPTIC